MVEISGKVVDIVKHLQQYIPQNYTVSEPIYTNPLYIKLKDVIPFEFTVDDMLDALEFMIEDTHIIYGFKRYTDDDAFWKDETGEMCYDENDKEGWIYYMSISDQFNPNDCNELEIDYHKIFSDRFLANYNGFECGDAILDEWEMRTDAPPSTAKTFYSNNYDLIFTPRGIPSKLKSQYIVKKTYWHITKENINTLKMLDLILTYMKPIKSINIYNPLRRIHILIEEKKIRYHILKQYAKEYLMKVNNVMDESKIDYNGSKLNYMINYIKRYIVI